MVMVDVNLNAMKMKLGLLTAWDLQLIAACRSKDERKKRKSPRAQEERTSDTKSPQHVLQGSCMSVIHKILNKMKYWAIQK